MKTMLNQELSDLVKIIVQAAKKGKPILLFSSKLMNDDHDFVLDFVVDNWWKCTLFESRCPLLHRKC